MGVYIPGGFATQGPAPTGYHVPSKDEWVSVYNIWTALGGGSSDGTNFGIALKLPFAGQRGTGSSNVDYQGIYANYWSSTRYNGNNAHDLYFSSSELKPQYTYRRGYGISVRCFRNSPAIPNSSWTKLYGTSIESGGIFWNSSKGLISLSSDGQTWITIMDKNLGATQVWNSGDTLSQANCGYYYQRGNNYGFPFTGSVTTSSTQVDASTYGPGNYYSSSTFITRSSSPYRWDTSDNGNLRGGVDGNVPLMSELKNAYIGEYRVPGANTVAYFPLENNAIDVKNNITLTSDGNTNYTTVGGVKSAEFTKSNFLYNTNVSYVPQGDVAKTMSIWLYIKGANNGWAGISQIGGNGAGKVFGLGCNQGTKDLIMTRSWSVSSAYTTTLNTRYNVVVVYENSTWKMYVNGNLEITWNTTAPTDGYNIYLGENIGDTEPTNKFYGNLSNFIIENKARTEQEISNYYNLTKGNYGL